jgi:hypothetical protein
VLVPVLVLVLVYAFLFSSVSGSAFLSHFASQKLEEGNADSQ